MILQLLISFLLVGTTVAFGGGKGLMGLSFEQISEFRELESDGSYTFCDIACCLTILLTTTTLIATTEDFVKPVYYYLELQVASKSIPNVSKIIDRKKLKDYPLENVVTNNSFDHSKWDSVLKRHVKVGAGSAGAVSGINLVDYAGVKADDDFCQYLSLLEEANVQQMEPPEQLAFWMNAYNALCINIIIQHESKNNIQIGSITELSKPNNPVWDQIAGTVAGKEITLNGIEHDQLRKVWDEPLIHACIVCASASCPNLRPEAFLVPKLKDQMEDQMRLWMKNDSKGIKLTGNCLELSRIFLWFGADFGQWHGIRTFLPHFIEDEQLKARVVKGDVSVRYFDYGWQINRA